MLDHPQPKQWMRTEAAARYMHHSPKTLEKWRVYGTGPEYVKMGRVVLYDALGRFFRARERGKIMQNIVDQYPPPTKPPISRK